eukprot:SAG31_NODE_8423_length_1455_cov_1.409292_1_plen_181_part_00
MDGAAQYSPAQLLAFNKIFLSLREGSATSTDEPAGEAGDTWQQILMPEIANLIAQKFWDAKTAKEREVAVKIRFPGHYASGTIVPVRMMPGQTVADLRRLLASSTVDLGRIGPVNQAAWKYPLVHLRKRLNDTATIGELGEGAISVELRPGVSGSGRVCQLSAFHLIQSIPRISSNQRLF